MDNLDLYNKVRSVPDDAKKKIEAGRLKGFTNINPQWRIKKLTEIFGVCGFGWKTKTIRTWLDQGANNEVVANVEIELFVKIDDEWSEAIPGIGGSRFVSKESSGLYVDDEAYKKAHTDALSVACKALGIGADVYYEKDSTKYDSRGGSSTESPTGKNQPKTRFQIVNDLIKDTWIKMSEVTNFVKQLYGATAKIDTLSDENFEDLLNKLKKNIEANQ